jgi:uncharacterized membrane protein YvbJ
MTAFWDLIDNTDLTTDSYIKQTANKYICNTMKYCTAYNFFENWVIIFITCTETDRYEVTLHRPSELTSVRFNRGEPGSSGSIVSAYGLDDRAIEVRYPEEEKGLFL